MTNSAKHILLIIVVSGAVLQQNTPTKCDKHTQKNIAGTSDEFNPFFEHSSESNTDNGQPKTVTSCNSLLNLLPAANNFVFNPGENEMPIRFRKVIISSQTFVFQEPDPPRLG